jgi:8-oxo-dGTP pyrophosphatase MutT (NUDIX family)
MKGQREFASAILVDTGGWLLLQQRDNVPGILYPGMIAMFGGHREGSETFLQCVAREVREEIGYLVAAERFTWMASYRGHDPSGGPIFGEFFFARDIPSDALHVTEGALLTVERPALTALMPRFVPSAHWAMEVFLRDFAAD